MENDGSSPHQSETPDEQNSRFHPLPSQEEVPVAEGGPADLTDLERAILEFERQHYKYAGAKEAQIRQQFDLSPTRYYQKLNRLLDSPHAVAAYPQVVYRLRRLRENRLGQRRS